jgi:hypothetical protein
MKRNWRRIAVDGLFAILLVVGLALVAQVLVNSVNIVELVKRFHGG